MGCFCGSGSAMLQRMGVAWPVNERVEATSLKGQSHLAVILAA